MTENRYLIFDIGGSSIKYGLLDNSGEIYRTNKTPTPKDLESFKERIMSIVREENNGVVGVGFSAPGQIIAKTAEIKKGGSLPFLDGLRLRELIQSEFDLPVAAINDGKAAAVAENWFGHLKDVENGAVITLGTGLGGGIILNNELFNGIHYQAGEFSDILQNPNVSSDEDLMASHASAVKFVKKGSSILNLEIEDGYTVFEEIEKGENKKLLKLFDDYTRQIAFTILTIQAILDLERIILGGGISEQAILIEKIKEKYIEMKRSMPTYDRIITEVEIGVCKFKNNSNLIGATYNLFMELDKQYFGTR